MLITKQKKRKKNLEKTKFKHIEKVHDIPRKVKLSRKNDFGHPFFAQATPLQYNLSINLLSGYLPTKSSRAKNVFANVIKFCT